MEFGTRRAQEMDAAIWELKVAVIGGANGTSNAWAGKPFESRFEEPSPFLIVYMGNDYQAFKAHAETHKDCVFRRHLYDTLRIGVPVAIQVARETEKINSLAFGLIQTLIFLKSSPAIRWGWVYKC